MAKTLYSQCRVPRFNPWSGNYIPHITTKSLKATTKDPACHNSGQRSHVPQLRPNSVQSLRRVRLFVTLLTAAHQASLSIINSWSLIKLMSIKSVLPSNHLNLSSPSLPAFNLSQHQGLFQWVSSSHQVAKISELRLHHQSFQWIFRTDFL